MGIEQSLIALLVPLLIAGIKKLAVLTSTTIPNQYIPIIAPLLGMLATVVFPLVGIETGGTLVDGAILGSAGVGVREAAVKVAREVSG